jgi:Holliday junction resolvase RusA-like endonuclease
MSETITFFVSGTPIPQGSMKAFRVRNSDKIVMTHSNSKLSEWRNLVSDKAINEARILDWAMAERGEAIEVKFSFKFPRPKSRKNDIRLTTRPDLDKIVRSLNDSLTGILYEDDSQIDCLYAEKSYISGREIPGVMIIVTKE